MPFGILNALFGGGAAQPQTNGGVGGNAQDQELPLPGIAGPGLTLQNRPDRLQTEAAMQMQQQAVTQTVTTNQAAFGLRQGYTTAHYGRLIDYTDGMYTTPPERPRARNIMECIQDLGNTLGREGLAFSEIVVPKNTFMSLYRNYATPQVRFYDGTDPTRPPTPMEIQDSFAIATPIGYIRITCEQKTKKFDLEKYIEVV